MKTVLWGVRPLHIILVVVCFCLSGSASPVHAAFCCDDAAFWKAMYEKSEAYHVAVKEQLREISSKDIPKIEGELLRSLVWLNTVFIPTMKRFYINPEGKVVVPGLITEQELDRWVALQGRPAASEDVLPKGGAMAMAVAQAEHVARQDAQYSSAAIDRLRAVLRMLNYYMPKVAGSSLAENQAYHNILLAVFLTQLTEFESYQVGGMESFGLTRVQQLQESRP